jgi:hypothetical protein
MSFGPFFPPQSGPTKVVEGIILLQIHLLSTEVWFQSYLFLLLLLFVVCHEFMFNCY